MQQKSLGLIEVVGLTAGVEAADVALKSANVELVGYEFAKGGGWITVKILGDVGAVKAAISSAKVAVGKFGKVISSSIIARPSIEIDRLISSEETVPRELAEKTPAILELQYEETKEENFLISGIELQPKELQVEEQTELEVEDETKLQVEMKEISEVKDIVEKVEVSKKLKSKTKRK